MKIRIPLILASLFCLCSFIAEAQIYEWIDKSGVRHFTNVPPPPGAKIVDKQEAIPYDEEADKKRMQEDQEIRNRVLQEQEPQTGQQAGGRPEPPQIPAGSSSSEGVTEEPYIESRDQVLRYGQPIPERGPIMTPLPGGNLKP